MTSKKATKKVARKATKKATKKVARKATKKVARKATKKVARKATKKAAKKATKKVARKATKKVARKATKKVARKATKKVARKRVAKKKIDETDEDNYSLTENLGLMLLILFFVAPGLFLGGLFYVFMLIFGADAGGAVLEILEIAWWVLLGGGLIYGIIGNFLSGGSSSTDYHANDNQFDGD